jgi:hypothetical protein
MKRLFFEIDVSGWDRLIPLLRQAWEMRRKFLKYPQSLNQFFDWVIEQTVRAFIVLPNGDIVRRKCGNNSGSGTTTSDNCIMHQMITNYLREKLKHYFGVDQEDVHSDVYGDDLLSSMKVDEEIEQLMLRTLKDVLRNMYKEFNLTVKESACHVQKGPIGMHFLGATCRSIGDRFIPAYDSERIYSAYVTEIDKHGPDDEVSKAYALMHLAWEDEELFSNIREFIQTIMADKEIHGPFIDGLRTTGVPRRQRVIHGFWLGVEGSYDFPDPPLHLEEEVLKRNREEQSNRSFLNCNQNGMLSRQQFEKKHAAKFANLSNGEKSKRYQDYQNASKGGSRPKRAAPARRKQRVRASGIQSTINPPRQIAQLTRNEIRTDETGMGRTKYPRKQPNRRANMAMSSGGSVKLSMCGQLYISGLLLPFQFFDGTSAKNNRGLGMSGDIPTELPCVPTFPSIK